jgi:hypothetical protein
VGTTLLVPACWRPDTPNLYKEHTQSAFLGRFSCLYLMTSIAPPPSKTPSAPLTHSSALHLVATPPPPSAPRLPRQNTPSLLSENADRPPDPYITSQTSMTRPFAHCSLPDLALEIFFAARDECSATRAARSTPPPPRSSCRTSPMRRRRKRRCSATRLFEGRTGWSALAAPRAGRRGAACCATCSARQAPP